MGKQQLYRPSTAQSTAMAFLIAAIVISALGFIGYETITCKRGRLPAELQTLFESLTIAAGVFALYSVASLVKRRVTVRPLPLERVAAFLCLLASLIWPAIYFLGCERMI